MSTTATIPITVTPEAAARIAELGMQREFELMLEHTRQAVPGLRSIAVVLELPYDTGDETGITIEATMDDPHLADDPTRRNWDAWIITTFPPDVYRYFIMLTVYGSPHDR